MAIPFNPPDWLIKEYLNRPSPAQEASTGIEKAMQLYADQKAKEQATGLAQQSKDVEMAKGIADSGQDFTSALDKIKAQRAVPVPAKRSPIIEFFMGSGSAPTTPVVNPTPGMPPVSTGTISGMTPATSSDFMPTPEIPPMPAPQKSISESFMTPEGQLNEQAITDYKTQHGRKGLENLDKQLSLSNTLQTAHDRRQPQPVYDKKGKKQFSVEPNARIVEPAHEGQAETRSERLAGSFRKELTASKPYQNLTMAKSAADNIAQAAANPGAYGDLASLFDYMKALDPTSVVREGEQDTFRKTGSFTQGLANTMTKLVNGQSITPEQRQELIKYTKNRLKVSHSIYKNHAEPTLRQTTRLKVDPLEVDPFYGQNFDDDGTPAPTKSFIKPGEEAEYEEFKRSMAGGK